MLNAANAVNTTSTYITGISAFEKFRVLTQLSVTWPPPLDQLVNFIAYLSLNGYLDATARAYISAIGYKCKIEGLMDNTNRFIVAKLLQGFKRLRNRVDGRLPLTEHMLAQLIRVLTSICHNKYEAILFSSAYTLTFFAFLRVGELTLSKGNNSEVILGIQDVKIKDKNLQIVLRHSKTDQFNKGVTIVLNSHAGITCPVHCMIDYMQIRPKISGPLYCHFDGKPITRYQFSAVMGKALAVLGYNSKLYTTHSFRIGAATAAAEKGLSDEEIKLAGRWKSSAFQTYIRSPLTCSK